jgi:hypothetical protein
VAPFFQSLVVGNYDMGDPLPNSLRGLIRQPRVAGAVNVRIQTVQTVQAVRGMAMVLNVPVQLAVSCRKQPAARAGLPGHGTGRRGAVRRRRCRG